MKTTNRVFIENGSMYYGNTQSEWTGVYNESIIKMGEVEMDVDGYYKLFLEPVGGYFDEVILIAMAEALRKINELWNEQVKVELEILDFCSS